MGDIRRIEETVAHLKEIKPDAPELIPFEDTLLEDGVHAVHSCIWAPTEESLFGLESSETQAGLRVRAIVLMHMRHDGHLGFAGGMVDESLTGLPLAEGQQKAIEALRRELKEELNFDTKKHKINVDSYIFSARSSKKKNPLFLHFYSCQVSLEDMIEVETRSLVSYEHGREVFGNIRVPLFTMSDGYRGFPAFLNNQFIGSTKSRLLLFLLHFGLMSKHELKTALVSSANNV